MLQHTLKLLRATLLHRPTPSHWLTRAHTEMRKKLDSSTAIFGVFVTLKRSSSHTRKRFPHAEPAERKHLCVQACLGYWDASYEPFTDGPFLVNKLVHLAQSFERSDSRYKNFERLPLCDDAGATVELTLMQQPLTPIDHQGTVGSTHTPFSNNTHGCIIVAPFGTATFLPDVYPDTPFHTIRDHLIAKASNGSVSSHEQLSSTDQNATMYYAYPTTVLCRRVNVSSPRVTQTNRNRKRNCERDTTKTRRKTKQTSSHRLVKSQTQARLSQARLSNVPTLLIPHAGKVYAGRARQEAFACVPNPLSFTRIDYIATVHNPTQSPSKDHSYEWVKDELHAHFPNATHRVHYPSTWAQARTLAKYLSTSHAELQLVIGTTDLMHYGEQYNYTPSHNTHASLNAWKVQQEKPLLHALRTVAPARIQELCQTNPHTMCGPFATYATLQFLVNNRYKKRGKCVAYYDSADIHYSPEMFVSYVAFVYL